MFILVWIKGFKFRFFSSKRKIKDSWLTASRPVYWATVCRRLQAWRTTGPSSRAPRRSLLGRHGKCRAPLRRCSLLLQHHQDSSLPAPALAPPASARSAAAATTSSVSPQPPDWLPPFCPTLETAA
jgi:hypothetical protein